MITLLILNVVTPKGSHDTRWHLNSPTHKAKPFFLNDEVLQQMYLLKIYFRHRDAAGMDTFITAL